MKVATIAIQTNNAMFSKLLSMKKQKKLFIVYIYSFEIMLLSKSKNHQLVVLNEEPREVLQMYPLTSVNIFNNVRK